MQTIYESIFCCYNKSVWCQAMHKRSVIGSQFWKLEIHVLDIWSWLLHCSERVGDRLTGGQSPFTQPAWW